MKPVAPVGPAIPAARFGNGQQDPMRAAARELEIAFLSEMLKHAGLGEAPDGFGGGVGEEQFASFLVREQAAAMVDAGGIGLAETLFNALKEKQNGN